MASYLLPVIGVMIGDDKHAVLRTQELLSQDLALESNLVMAHHGQDRNVRIIIGYDGTAALEQFHDFEGGRFAWIRPKPFERSD